MKKYFGKFKDLKSTNKKLYYATICMFVLVGFTFAYVIDQISGGAISKVFITADTADVLEFKVDPETIEIKPSQFNFTQGGEDLSGTATATARLKANSTKNTAGYTYNVYLGIIKNEYVYTTPEHKPEMILQVTDPNGNPVTSLEGLTYNEELQGFDITNVEDIITISENYEITSNSSKTFTEQKWTVIVKFINLDTNQVDNEGKTLECKLLIQRQKAGNINIAVNNLPTTFGPLTAFNCGVATATYNSKYNRIEVNNISSKYADCSLNFTNRNSKTKINDYIMELAGTTPTQGKGELVHETFISPNYSNATKLSQNEYEEVSQYSGGIWSSTDGDALTNAFSFSDDIWTSNPSNLTSNSYYHFKFSLPAGSYYQICYEISKSSNNSIYIYSENVPLINRRDGAGNGDNTYSSESEAKSGCINLGYLESQKNYRIVQDTGNEIATIRFYIEKTNDIENFDAGYRYEGQDPNNYVWFNNELWRIIGVMNEESHGQIGQNLVKIIRNETIGRYQWDLSDSNGNWWDISYMNAMLNNYYLLSQSTTSSYCSSGGKCNFKYIGIKDGYRNMIKKVFWPSVINNNSKIAYLEGVTVSELYKHDMITYQSGSQVGLMSVSDYGFAAPSESCARTIYVGLYDKNEGCTMNNWLFNKASEWTITPDLKDKYVQAIAANAGYGAGYIRGDSTTGKSSVRPVLYLDSEVYVIDGDGSITNPYIIGM